jgi:hypothetical protein
MKSKRNLKRIWKIRKDGVRERYWVKKDRLVSASKPKKTKTPKRLRTRPRSEEKLKVLSKVNSYRVRQNYIDKKFHVLADLSSKLRTKPIMVGGSAVDFYLRRPPMSYDLDLIAEANKELIGLLEKGGYKKEGRMWYKGDTAIEVVGSRMSGRRVSTERIPYTNKTIRIISVEDLIIDRLCACKFWKSEYDCDCAKFLLDAYWLKLDRNYLRRRADIEDVVDVMKRIQKI